MSCHGHVFLKQLGLSLIDELGLPLIDEWYTSFYDKEYLYITAHFLNHHITNIDCYVGLSWLLCHVSL